jgi:hypothetical protein
MTLQLFDCGGMTSPHSTAPAQRFRFTQKKTASLIGCYTLTLHFQFVPPKPLAGQWGVWLLAALRAS